MKSFKTKKLVYIACLTALGLILHVAEGFLPPLFVFAPGTRIGFANIVTLFALIVLGFREGFIVLVIRCVLGSLFSLNVGTGLVYSLCGGIASFVVVSSLYLFAFPKISVPAVSVAGAVTHNIVQLFIASAFAGQIRVLYLLPLNISASIIAGVFIGFAVHFTIKYLPEKMLYSVCIEKAKENDFSKG